MSAFMCSQCGAPVEARNAVVGRLFMAGKPPICDNCRNGQWQRWSKADYQEYLKTDHWERRRQRSLALAGQACQICKSTKNLNVHHNDYSRLGSELDSDLFVVCEKHHKMIHER